MKPSRFQTTLFLCLAFLVLSALNLAAQCDNMREYRGMTATLAANATAGQSFTMSEDCGAGNTFSSFTINHQTKRDAMVTIRIYEGQSVSADKLRYTQENITVPVAGGNVMHTITLGGGVGDLSYKNGQQYTITLTPNVHFQWNGEYNNKAPGGVAYWPNNGGMFTDNGYDYLYKVGVSTTSTELFDDNKYYRLTTAWQGDGKSLDIVNSGDQNQPLLAKSGNYTGQMWRIKKSGDGIYTLSTKWRGPDMILDCISGPNQLRPVLNKETGYSGGAWMIKPLGGGYYQITNMWLNDKSLDIVNDGENNKIQVAKTGNYGGQKWKIVEFK